MKRIIILLLLAAFFAVDVQGQTAKQYLKAAEEEIAGHNYYGAMIRYREAMSLLGETPELMYKYAEAARLFASYTYADTAYTKVLRSEKASEFPLTKYWLATVKKKQGKYKESQELFQQFISENPRAHGEYTDIAAKEVEALNWAITEIENVDENVSIEHLGKQYNSTDAEYAAVLQGENIYFTSQNFRKKFDKQEREIFKVLKGKENSRKIDTISLNEAEHHTANLTFNQNNTRVYYTICNYVDETAIIRCQIYYRNIDTDGKFGEAVPLPKDINMEGFTATEPNVGKDPNLGVDWLYFVSDRPGGKGGKDIWAATIYKDGTFSPPINLEAVNTEGDDVTPFFQQLSNTLYFSSNGRQGFGGFDIYKSDFRNGEWQEVEHLPAPYNASYDDTHYWANEGGTKGYFASNRLGSYVKVPELEACCFDVYSFALQVIELKVFTFNKRNNEQLSGVTMQLVELTKDVELTLATMTNPDGNDFNFDLKKGSMYVLLASKEGFLPLTDTVDLTIPANTQTSTIERKLYLVPEEVELDVFSFNKRTMNPLKGVEVRLVVEGQEIDFKKNTVGNDVHFVLERGKKYELIGSKVAYFSDTAYIDLRYDKTTTNIEQQLLLRPKEIEDFPPLVIYFDNDHPNPATRKTTTELSYEETFLAYMEKKDLFKREYSKALVGQDSFVAARRIEAFFDREVNNGYESLKVFTENVLQILQDGGFKVELVIQGFTSPRASADYNYTLSQRRSDCLKNHFETWNGGVLRPYIDQGLLTMEVVGYGEKLAPQYISDRLDDERESIYSVVASFERKVAIIGARRVAEN